MLYSSAPAWAQQGPEAHQDAGTRAVAQKVMPIGMERQSLCRQLALRNEESKISADADTWHVSAPQSVRKVDSTHVLAGVECVLQRRTLQN